MPSTRDSTAGSDQPTDVRERVEKVINLIRPAVQADGGDLELVGVTHAGVVQIRLHGACVRCPSRLRTRRQSGGRESTRHALGISTSSLS